MHEVLIISPPPGYSIRVYQSLILLNPIGYNDFTLILEWIFYQIVIIVQELLGIEAWQWNVNAYK